MESSTSTLFNREILSELAALQAHLLELKQERDELKKRLETAEGDALCFKHKMEYFANQLYGVRSERRLQAGEDIRYTLFPELNDDTRPLPPPQLERIEYTRRKSTPEGTRKERASRFPDYFPREKVIVAPNTTTCECCNKELSKLGEVEITEKLCCSRNPFYVKEFHRQKLTCSACDKPAPLPLVPEVFPRSLFCHTTAAFFIVNKYRFSLPLYRQGTQLADLKVKVSNDSIIRVTNDALNLLAPIADEIRKSVLSDDVLLADDTRLTAATGSVAKKLPSYESGCLWGLFGKKREFSCTFAPSRTYESCKSLLAGFKGYLAGDGYKGFDEVAELNEDIILVNCNNHARRYFIKAEKSDPTRAGEAIAYYQALYKIEEECKEASPQDRQRHRETYAVPILNRFKEWLDKVGGVVGKGTPLYKAIQYVTSRWKSLTVYVSNGDVPFDTMDLEREFRGVAVSRKNFLHASSEAGAITAATAFTLIQSALLVGIDPFIYIADVLDRISEVSDPSKLIPRIWKQHFLDDATRTYQSPTFGTA